MPVIIITPLSEVEPTIRKDKPSHLVTLLSPEHMIETPEGITPRQHLRLSMNDVPDVFLAEVPPGFEHVEQLLDFGRGWTADAPMLVHCWAGISRSTAAAYIILCDRFGPGSEADIANALRLRAPHAFPNPLMIKLADYALGRGNRMVDAIRKIGRGSIVAIGERVEMPVRLSDL